MTAPDDTPLATPTRPTTTDEKLDRGSVVPDLTPRRGSDPIERRNYLLGVANGGIYQGGESFVDSNTVLPVILSSLTRSNALIGLASAMGDIGWLLPQLFVAPWVSRQPRQLPIYQRAAMVRGGCLFALAIAAWLLRGRPGALVAAFFACYGVYSMGSGFGAVAFMEVVGRTVRTERLGAYFAQRLFWGGVLGALAGLIARQVLRLEDAGSKLAILFGLAAVVCSSAYALFGAVHEPETHARPTPSSPLALLRHGLEWMRHEPAFRRVFICRATLSVWLSSSPFLTLFAVNALGGGGRAAGTLLVSRLVGYVLSNLAWQRMSKHWGNRAILRIATAAACALLFAATAVAWASPWRLGLLSARAAVLALEALAALGGAVHSGLLVGYASVVIQNAPDGQRQSFVSLSNTFLGPTMLLPMVGGLVVDAFDAPRLFLVCGLVSLVGVWAAARLPERAARPLA